MNRYCFALLLPAIPQIAQQASELLYPSSDSDADNRAADYGIYHSYKVWRTCATICKDLPCVRE